LGTQHDVVNVSGTAVVDGLLKLSLINGFEPTDSQSFLVFNATSLFGLFDNVANGQRLDTTDGGGSFRVNYGLGSAFNPNQIVLSHFEAALQGDFDGDGDVDGGDFLRWQRGDSPNPLSVGDLNVWKANFGASGSSAASTTSVPEMIPSLTLVIVTVMRRKQCERATA
jgi:hypothetical protein